MGGLCKALLLQKLWGKEMQGWKLRERGQMQTLKPESETKENTLLCTQRHLENPCLTKGAKPLGQWDRAAHW